ncbi:uncharacterized protein V6R79_026399 [Siganus canaliculatus]
MKHSHKTGDFVSQKSKGAEQTDVSMETEDPYSLVPTALAQGSSTSSSFHLKMDQLSLRTQSGSSRGQLYIPGCEPHEVERMSTLLLKTFNDLSYEELKIFRWLLQFTCFHKNLPLIPWSKLQTAAGYHGAKMERMVNLLMETYGQQCVEVIMSVFMNMNRTDLVQKLSDTSSAPEAAGSSSDPHGAEMMETESLDTRWPELSQKVDEMMSVAESFVEVLTQLDLKRFIETLQRQINFSRCFSDIPLYMSEITELPDVLLLMVQSGCQQFVRMTKEVLTKMNRTDLVLMLSVNSSDLRKEHLGADELLFAATRKVATMAAVKHLLLETLMDLTDEEHKKFKMLLQSVAFSRNLPVISVWRHNPRCHAWYVAITEKKDGSVERMVHMFGQQCLEIMGEIFMNMKRPDLVQRLPVSSTALKGKHFVDEQQLEKVERMWNIRELLLKTFSDLSSKELKIFRWLLQFTCFHKNLPLIPWRELHNVGWYHGAKIEHISNLLMETYGQQCVEVIMSVFMNMNRTDLVQRLSDTSSAPEAAGSSSDPHGAEMMETESVDTRWPQLSQKVDEMMSVAESLVEVLTQLDLQRFIETLQSEIDFYRWRSNIPLNESEITELPDVLLLMVQSGCQQFVRTTEEILKNMDRTDLVPMLSASSSESRKEHLGADEQLFAVTRKVATMAAVKQLLLETLKDLTDEEHKKFKKLLQPVAFRRNLPDISVLRHNTMYSRLDLTRFVLMSETKERTVEQMVHTFGQQCLQIMGEIFMNMKRPDVVQRLPVSNTALKGKRFVEEQQLEKAAVQQILVEKLNGLSYLELEKFKWLLQFTCFRKSLPQVDRWYLNRTDRAELVNLMTDTWGHQSLEVVNEVLMDMNRTDLGETVSEKVKHQSSLLQNEICNEEELQQDSRKWTLLKPEVESRDVKEASTYSHQSEAGSFECSVSGLRWVCQEKVSFKYQFGSCEEPLKRMENIQYRPAGPLIDLTVSSGSFDEVYLPHWISIKNNPEILDQFAVLHIDDCGDAVEKVTEVTTSHVKLPNPTFSLNMVLVKWLGFSVEIACKVLIYENKTTSLELHVYLIPRDAGLEEKLDRKEMKFGYNIKPLMPYPEDDLKMNDKFCLTADLQDATILPESRVIQLRYHTDPNFFYVFTENPNARFNLSLTNVNSSQKVWTCPIQMDTSRAAAAPATCQPPPAPPEHAQDPPEEGVARASPGAAGADACCDDEHFVDKHEAELKRRVTNVPAILDDLLQSKVIQQEQYEKLLDLHPTQEQMRRLFLIIVKATSAQKDIFYKVLKKNHKSLIKELEKKHKCSKIKFF